MYSFQVKTPIEAERAYRGQSNVPISVLEQPLETGQCTSRFIMFSVSVVEEYELEQDTLKSVAV